MTKIATRVIVGLTAALTFAAQARAHAQNAPAPASTTAPIDPVLAAQKAAFDAMPEADRKAVQEALVWSGLYVGTVDGAFGKRTRESILAWQANARAAGPGSSVQRSWLQ